jgi:glutamyl-tRNA(Gln) amidotransferase subunit E
MKAGIEVHQQLATGKLFCDCPAELSETTRGSVLRRLRATGGENHAIDPAAAFQAARDLQFRYEVVPSSCLVELDEEPPHALSAAALDVALTMALLLHARPLDEVEVMRKIVVDGSNTAGFQRTALIGVDGWLSVGGKRYSIPTICLEEDAARKVGESDGELTYRLDRLGIPLVEIATGPEIASGAEAREVAEEIGLLLRATGRARRGIGTIREDVNVSTEGGARVEIKGVQELRLLHRYAELEEERQRVLLRVRDRLAERAPGPPTDPVVDVTALMPQGRKGMLPDAAARGQAVLALRLPGFAGLLRAPEGASERLGRELADHARAAGLKGLIHSDELPGYGLETGDVDALAHRVGAHASDAFVLVTGPERGMLERALSLVRGRAGEAIRGIPTETRDPLPDGRTRYSRPLPGRDRMYPETDVPPIRIPPERLEWLLARLPERPEATRARIVSSFGLGAELVVQLQRAGHVEALESLVHRGFSASLVTRLLIQDLPAAEEQAPSPHGIEVTESMLAGTLGLVAEGTIAKEGMVPVLVAFRQGAPTARDAAAAAGLSGAGVEDLAAAAARVVERNAELVAARGEGAFSALMGDLMKELRGRRDGREVADALRTAIRRRASIGTAGA